MTVNRHLKAVGPALLSSGKARNTRYAMRRLHPSWVREHPVYAIDETGQAHAIGSITPVTPEGYHFDLQEACWPKSTDLPECRHGYWRGLPYPLADMRPQGFMGRWLARTLISGRDSQDAMPELTGMSANPEHWHDDLVLAVIARHGIDQTGHWVVGEAAIEQWQAARRADAAPPPAHPKSTANVDTDYALAARQALAFGQAGSSAAGEFPKFLAMRTLPEAATPHVIVKFTGRRSPPTVEQDSKQETVSTVQRWADLLIAESLAAQTLLNMAGAYGILAPRCRVIDTDQRTMLEVERFDRVGRWGRKPLISLGTLDATFVGSASSSWPEQAKRLRELGLLDPSTVQAIARINWFGQLIGNTDMHGGNLSFHAQARQCTLAPVYDMLPMAYAPLPGGEIPALVPRIARWPRPEQRDDWHLAATWALAFWQCVADDLRISSSFRAISAAEVRQLQSMVKQA